MVPETNKIQPVQEEYLDLVDRNDKVIGKKSRKEIYAEGLSNFRVVNAFVVNSEGKMWIPRRSVDKRIFPLCLDMSMGGHVESGETYDQAFKRETAEELNVDTETTTWKLLGHLTPHEHGVSAFMNVYEISLNADPRYNTRDFIEFFWLLPSELLEKIKGGDRAKGDLPKLISKFFFR